MLRLGIAAPTLRMRVFNGRLIGCAPRRKCRGRLPPDIRGVHFVGGAVAGCSLFLTTVVRCSRANLR
uniref:Uncharacterized protein n=1 Tax=uncultured marine virus TaxID=186617 RepID=A0A0F7L5P2_9VIRU|nr:hypothetical protein [uncultured marine virus]